MSDETLRLQEAQALAKRFLDAGEPNAARHWRDARHDARPLSACLCPEMPS